MILEKIQEFAKKHKSTNCWANAIFKNIYFLTNDARGQFGEELISEIFHELKYQIDEDISNINIHPDGHYDIKVCNTRIEIKTSCKSSNGWQHEPLYAANVCDIVIFVDFDYDKFYISIVRNNELPLKKTVKELFGDKHGTLRKDKEDGYKLDFSKTTIKHLTKANRCKEFDSSVSMEELKQFVGEKFNELL